MVLKYYSVPGFTFFQVPDGFIHLLHRELKSGEFCMLSFRSFPFRNSFLKRQKKPGCVAETGSQAKGVRGLKKTSAGRLMEIS
jgi:hypothetical protein